MRDREERNSVFVDETGAGFLCFDSCDKFGAGCSTCDRVQQGGQSGREDLRAQ